MRLEGCGVCASSLPLYEGRPWFQYPRPPGSPGHEGWGRVEQVGEGVALSIGQRVAFLGQRSFAELDVAHEEAVVALPAALDGRPFPGEPLGCAMNAFRRSGIEPGHTVAIVGVGFLGTTLTALARDAGARVVAISRRASSREFGTAFGAEAAVPMESREETVAAAREAAGVEGFDRVLECAGLQETLDVASDLVAVRGRLVIAGYHQDGLRQVDLQGWNWRGIDVINAHERDPEEYVRGMREAVEAVAAGRLDVQPLLTHAFALDEVTEALESAARRPPGFMKAWVSL